MVDRVAVRLMALPGIPQAFAVEDAKELTQKLWWEIEAYRDEPSLQSKLWRAFNCAVTAWCITDWVWKEQHKAKGMKEDDWQKLAQSRCLELRLCKYIANASKHGGVDRSPDSTINVIVRATDAPASSSDDVSHSSHWEIMVSNNSGDQDALKVFYKVHDFWMSQVYAVPPETSQ